MFHRNRYYLILSLVMYALAFPMSAQAYLDPATGSYLIQLVVAFIAGGLFMVKVFWHKLWSLFGFHKKPAKGAQSADGWRPASGGKPVEETSPHAHKKSETSESDATQPKETK